MLKKLWVGWWGGGPLDFSVSPSPLRTDWDLGLTWFGDGLDNIVP